MALIRCTNCGNSLTNDDRYCQQCGENNSKFISQAVIKESIKEEVIEPSKLVREQTYQEKPQEGQGIGWFILGLTFPFVGLILFFSLKGDKPNASSMSLAGAIVGAVIGAILLL
jgi:uncharacterized membrane protein YvbJ